MTKTKSYDYLNRLRSISSAASGETLLGVVLLGLSCGCASSSAILQEVELGGFFVDRAGSQVQAQSRIPTTATNVPLWFFAEGLALNTVEEFP